MEDKVVEELSGKLKSQKKMFVYAFLSFSVSRVKITEKIKI